MTEFDFEQGMRLFSQGHGFAVLLTALAMKADTGNLARLRQAFPQEIQDIDERYNNPGGKTNWELAEEERAARC